MSTLLEPGCCSRSEVDVWPGVIIIYLYLRVFSYVNVTYLSILSSCQRSQIFSINALDIIYAPGHYAISMSTS